MPFCDDCDKYWTPNSMNDDGTCPRCGTDLDPPPGPDEARAVDRDDEGVPWHFKLMIVALVAYLGWRFVEIGVKIFT